MKSNHKNFVHLVGIYIQKENVDLSVQDRIPYKKINIDFKNIEKSSEKCQDVDV